MDTERPNPTATAIAFVAFLGVGGWMVARGWTLLVRPGAGSAGRYAYTALVMAAFGGAVVALWVSRRTPGERDPKAYTRVQVPVLLSVSLFVIMLRNVRGSVEGHVVGFFGAAAVGIAVTAAAVTLRRALDRGDHAA